MPIIAEGVIMGKNRLFDLLIKKKTGEITPEEQLELLELLKSREGHTIAAIVDEIYQTPVHFSASVSDEEVNASLNRVLNRIGYSQDVENSVKKRKFLSFRYVAAAASVVLMLSMGWWYFGKPSANEQALHIVSTEKGFKSDVVLPDGTKVKINADTKLSYPKSYNEDQREVYLEGEAFFDVVKDEKRPFIVHTNTIDIRVLGTAFNVRAYNDEANTETTLIRGSVEVALKKKNNQIIRLQPNEKVVVQNNYAEKVAEEIDPEPEVALMMVRPKGKDSTLLETQWMKKEISFDQDRLGDIIPNLEKWFAVTIEVKDAELLNRRFSGTIQNETLPEVLELFSLASGVKYKIDKNKVLIYK